MLFFALSDLGGATEAEPRLRIMKILEATPLIDGHNDLPYLLRQNKSAFDEVDITGDCTSVELRQTDLKRLRSGGVGGQFWSVYVPGDLPEPEILMKVLEQIDLVKRMIEKHPKDLAMAISAADIVRIHKSGKIASLIGVEGGGAIAESLGVLRQLRSLGVAYMTLTHERTTGWADSATDEPKFHGLSPFGVKVIAEMNREGMLIDLSHVSDDVMHDALKLSKAPVIFSHSSARALVDHPRNVPDDVLRTVAKNGGIVMVNFASNFISMDVRDAFVERAALEARLRALYPNDSAQRARQSKLWRSEHPLPHATISQVADHIGHISQIAGIDHVGLGSDFDGAALTPDGLSGVDGYPRLLEELMHRGWSSQDIAKLVGGNILRVMREVESTSKQLRRTADERKVGQKDASVTAR